MNRLFVTGATGLLGREFVRKAVAAEYTVRALARTNGAMAILRAAGAEPILADLFDASTLAAAVEGCSAVVHLATRIPPIDRWRRRSAWVENDRIRREGTRNLIDVALTRNVEAFVYPSATLVYPDRGSEWVDATRTAAVQADLTDSTLEAEHEVAEFAAVGRRGVTLRMGPFYGPESGQSRYILDVARRGFSPFIARDAAYHPFVWIGDAAAAIVASLGSVPSGTYDIVDDEPLSVAEIRSVLAHAAGRRRLWRVPGLLLRYSMGSSLAELSLRSRRVSNAAFKASSNWAPAVPDARDGWERIAREMYQR